MRTLTSTLTTAQQSDNRTPYIYLRFTSADGGTTYDYHVTGGSDDYVLQAKVEEMPYSSKGTIVLRNNDRTIPDLRGYWVEPGYGDVTTEGNEYEQLPRMWVKAQNEFSSIGQLYVQLDLQGMWEVLDEIEWKLAGTAPFYEYAYDTATPLTILQACFTAAGMTLTNTVDDGIIDTVSVYFLVNSQARSGTFDSLKDVIYRAISLTKCYIKLDTSMNATVVYPQTDDETDNTYYTTSTSGYLPAYFYNEKKNVLLPNKITVEANKAGSWDVTETSEDTDAQAMYDPDGGGEINQTWLLAQITNATDAAKIAAALLTKSKAEIMSVYFEVPHDASAELYDKDAVVDSR